MAMQAASSEYWTVEDYLAYEAETGIKHEYIDGQIYAMSGGTGSHSKLASYTGGLLIQSVSDDCTVFNSDMKVKISDEKYVYPDVTVVCGEERYDNEKETMLTNPTLVVEVTSNSSENYDLGAKARYYHSLASLQAYLVLDQARISAQLHTRHPDGWLVREFTGAEAVVPLDALGCTLSLGELYANIDLPTDDDD